jgi:hypothetical protein
MKELATISLILMVLVSMPAIRSIPRHVDPSGIPDEYPNVIDLLSIYASMMDKVLLEDFRGSLEKLKESMRIHVPKDVKYIYDRFNELLGDVLDKLNSTRRYIDVAKLNTRLGLLEDARGNLSMATYSLAQANLTYVEIRLSVIMLERMLRIPRNQLAVKLTSIEEVLARYRDEIRDLLDMLEALRETGLEETEVWIRIDKNAVWVGESIELSGFLRSVKGYPLEARTVSIYLDGRRVDLLSTDKEGYFSVKLPTDGLYKPFLQIYAEYIPSGGDVGRYKASKSNVITINMLYDEPLIHAQLSHHVALPGQVIHVYGWVNTSLGKLPDRIYLDAFRESLSRSLDVDGLFDFSLKIPEDVVEGHHRVRLYTGSSGIIAPSERVLTIFVEKIPINATCQAPVMALSGGNIVVTGRVMSSVGQIVTPIPYSKIIVSGFGNQSITYSDEGGSFKASINVPLSILTGYSKISLFIEPPSQLYKAYSVSLEIFIINPLYMLAPSILLAIALVYSTPLVKEVRATIGRKKSHEAVEEIYVPETPNDRFFYVEALLMVGDATGLYVREYETIREYLRRVREALGKTYQIFEQISMLAERELYGGQPANRMIVQELLTRLEEGLRR